MTGGVQQRACVDAHVAASFQPFTGFDPCDGDDPRVECICNPCAPQIAPAEDRQADPELAPIEPGLTQRFAFGLAALVAVAITAHLCWLSLGMPTLAQIPSKILETLNV